MAAILEVESKHVNRNLRNLRMGQLNALNETNLLQALAIGAG